MVIPMTWIPCSLLSQVVPLGSKKKDQKKRAEIRMEAFAKKKKITDGYPEVVVLVDPPTAV